MLACPAARCICHRHRSREPKRYARSARQELHVAVTLPSGAMPSGKCNRNQSRAYHSPYYDGGTAMTDCEGPAFSRHSFATAIAASSLLTGFSRAAAGAPFANLPQLDGELSFDPTVRAQYANDYGH